METSRHPSLLNTSSKSMNMKRNGLLKHQLQLTKRGDSDKYEIVPISDYLSFEKGLFIFIRACQLLSHHIEGVIMVGLAGPSGAGKTMFCDKLVGFMPGIITISMDNYNDASRVIDGNYDDPRVTDYDLLLDNINDLKSGKDINVPIYDFKLGCRVGFRSIKVPSSRIVVIEGIYALSEKLRPLLDMRVAVTGGVHFDLVKRVLRDINRAGQDPEEIIQQISETVYPMYKAFIEPDLETAHIHIRNKFNPFSGFQDPIYILKSSRSVSVAQIKAVLNENAVETTEGTYDIYLLPPGEDPETCQSYLRMRNRDGKYCLMFEEMVIDNPFIIYPRITFEVTVRLLGGLMTLGYTITTILKRTSHGFSDDRLCIKIDKLEQLQRKYVQVQGRDRNIVAEVAKKLGLEGSYIPHSYIEQIQREKLITGLMAPSEDLKSKLSLHENVLSPRLPMTRMLNKEGSKSADSKSLRWLGDEVNDTSFSFPTVLSTTCHEQENFRKPQLSLVEANGKCDMLGPNNSTSFPVDEDFAQLLDKLTSLNDRLDEILSRLGDLETKLTTSSNGYTQNHQNIILNPNALSRTLSQQNISLQGGRSLSQLSLAVQGHSMSRAFSQQNISLQVTNNAYANTSAPATDPGILEEVKDLTRGQQHINNQLDAMHGCIREQMVENQRKNGTHIWSFNDLSRMESIYTLTTLGFGLLSLGFIIGVAGVKAYQRNRR